MQATWSLGSTKWVSKAFSCWSCTKVDFAHRTGWLFPAHFIFRKCMEAAMQPLHSKDMSSHTVLLSWADPENGQLQPHVILESKVFEFRSVCEVSPWIHPSQGECHWEEFFFSSVTLKKDVDGLSWETYGFTGLNDILQQSWHILRSANCTHGVQYR